MQKVYYKIKYVTNNYELKHCIKYDLKEAIDFYDTLKALDSVLKVSLLIVNNTEDELTENQISNIKNKGGL